VVQQEMEKAAEELNFERAAAMRDRFEAMQSIIERQKVVFASDYKDSDVIAMARSDAEPACRSSSSARQADRRNISCWKVPKIRQMRK